MVSMRNGPRKESGRSTNISYRGLLPSLIFSLLLVLLFLFLLVIDQSGGGNVSGSCSVTGWRYRYHQVVASVDQSYCNPVLMLFV
jgi:hypothetical protein